MLSTQPTTRIVGNGLIANSFLGVQFPVDTLILASGVSNSKETDAAAFRREEDLVKREISGQPASQIIYFSTCSVSSGQSSPYIEHKLRMEQLVQKISASYRIFRLPQVVGAVRNSTLVSYLFDSVQLGRNIEIQTLATRNLIDATDVARLVTLFIDNVPEGNSVQNIASAHSVAVLDIVRVIASILETDAILKYVQAGYSQDIDISQLARFMLPSDPILGPDYWRHVLLKYATFFKLG